MSEKSLSNTLTNEYLDLILLRLFPQTHIEKHIKSTNDIYLHRKILKELTPNEYALSYLLKLIRKDIELNHRFQTLPCLNVIRTIIKNFSDDDQFSTATVQNLFFLFQHFYLHRNENVQSCVNIYIKDQILEDQEVKWLTMNYHLSNHVINRLLRYPARNKNISSWALKVLKDNNFENRISEIISILIEDDVPKFIQATPTQIIWAIYYAQISHNIKKHLLRERFCTKTFEDLFEVAERLNYIDICTELIDFARSKLRVR